MNINDLKVFLTLSSTLHFARTAEKHAISPPTLSRCIKRLEQEAGAALFDRDNRRVALTRAGRAYAEFAHDVLARWDAFQQQTATTSGSVSGEVSLYCSVTASQSLLSPLLAGWRGKFPQVDVRVNTGDQALSLQRLKENAEDFVIAARPENLPSNTLFKRLSADDLVFIAPSQGPIFDQLSGGDSRVWRELPWILAERGLSRSRHDSWFKGERLKPQVYAQVSGHEAIVSMVSLGFGVGLVPELVLGNSPLSGKIMRFRPAEVLSGNPLGPFEVGLCVLKRRLGSSLMETLWKSVNTH